MTTSARIARRLLFAVASGETMNYVWYTESTSETAGHLINRFGDGGKNLPTERPDLLICWGCWASKEDLEKIKRWKESGTKVLNHPIFIALNRLKPFANSNFSLAGLNTPVRITKSEALNLIEPVIARKESTQGGSGIKMCLCKADVNDAFNAGLIYFYKFIRPDTEYRVHVYKNTPYSFLQKTNDSVLKNNWVKNDNNRWEFENIEGNPQLASIGVKAVNIAKLDIGAVDILKSEDGKYYVLEVNSAPHLRKENRLKLYNMIEKNKARYDALNICWTRPVKPEFRFYEV